VSGWLLDTSVLSAFAPGKSPIPAEVAHWFREHSDELYLSTITAAEIAAGIAKLRRAGSTRRAETLSDWFERILTFYADRVLPLDLDAARMAGSLADATAALGRNPGFADVAIAAIAKSRDLAVLTINMRHFEPLGVAASDPFASG
jgi:predicted nucleic acid-binding protein